MVGPRQRSRHCLVGAVREMAAIRQRRGETGRQRDAHRQSACIEDCRQAGQQADVVDVGRRRGTQAIGPVVTERERVERHCGVDRTLKQGGVERQQSVAGGGGAFRKHHQTRTGVQCRMHFAPGVVRRLAAAAFDEHGVVAAAEPADQRPLRDIALGDEARRQQGVEDEDIDEGNVVADQQAVPDAVQAAASRFDMDAEQRQQLPRPDASQSLPHDAADQGK